MNNQFRKVYKLSELTEDQVLDFLDSVQTDEEVESSSDEDFSDSELVLDEITPEDEARQYTEPCQAKEITQHNEIYAEEECISEILKNDVFFNNELSVNLSGLECPSASTSISSEVPIVSMPIAEVSASTPSSSTRKSKRPRSPLPLIESSGPSNHPSAGGFNGIGKK